jgi:hypothetical protein
MNGKIRILARAKIEKADAKMSLGVFQRSFMV